MNLGQNNCLFVEKRVAKKLIVLIALVLNKSLLEVLEVCLRFLLKIVTFFHL